MKLHGAVGGVLFSIVAGALGVAGCSSSSSGTGGGGSGGGTTEPTITGCTQDSTLNCSGGGFGYACAAGDNPENTDNLVCSDPTANGSEDDFCCVVDTGVPSGCTPDDNITAACAEGYGFSCAAGDNPDTGDGSLVCSDPTPDGSNDDFCCTYTGSSSSSGGGGGGCGADSSLSCDAGTVGVSCTGGSVPDPSADGICSDPSPQSDGSDGYCCVDQTFSGCTQDDSVTGGCAYPSFGFSCASGSPDPSADDPTLTCSDPTTDPTTGDDLYCCQ